MAGAGVRTWPSGPGAPCARTTAPTATRGSYLPHDHARSPGLPVERGRPRRALRRRPAAVLRASRSGTGVDPILKERIFGLDRQRGQPRRGRQGVLVVPRLHATHSWMRWRYCYPQARVPLRRPRRREPRAAAGWTPEYELLDTGDLRRGPLLGHHRRLRQGGARTTRASGSRCATPGRTRPRCTCCRRCGSATRGRGACDDRKPTHRRPRTAPIVAEHHDARPHGRSTGDGTADGARLRERDQRRSGSGASTGSTAYPEGRDRRPRRRTAPTRSTPTARAPRRRCWYRLTVAAGRDRRDPAAPRARRAATSTTACDGDAGRRARREADELLRRAAPAATSTTRRVIVRQAFAGMMWTQAVLPLRRRALARRRPGRAAAARARGDRAATTSGATSTTAT